MGAEARLAGCNAQLARLRGRSRKLLMVQDPFDHTGSFTNESGATFESFKDVTSSVYLTQGARIVNVHVSEGE